MESPISKIWQHIHIALSFQRVILSLSKNKFNMAKCGGCPTYLWLQKCDLIFGEFTIMIFSFNSVIFTKKDTLPHILNSWIVDTSRKKTCQICWQAKAFWCRFILLLSFDNIWMWCFESWSFSLHSRLIEEPISMYSFNTIKNTLPHSTGIVKCSPAIYDDFQPTFLEMNIFSLLLNQRRQNLKTLKQNRKVKSIWVFVTLFLGSCRRCVTNNQTYPFLVIFNVCHCSYRVNVCFNSCHVRNRNLLKIKRMKNVIGYLLLIKI